MLLKHLQTVSEQYSDYVVGLQFESLPRRVVKSAKLCLIDFLGVMIAGASTQESRISRNALLSLSRMEANMGIATVVGSRSKADCLPASFCNSVSGHALEMDDTHREAIIHAGASVIPTALAISEMIDASGKDLLVSMIVGYEIAIRVALHTVISQREHGFHVTGICGVFGAAATAGKLLALDRDQMTNALGLAGTQASGLTEFLTNGDMSKRVAPARAANNGITSALLAKNGVTGPKSIFEGNNGYWKAYANTTRPFGNLENLGKSFEIERVGFKPYACCKYLHTSIECATNLRESIPDVHDIETIVVKTSLRHADYDTGKYQKQWLPSKRKYEQNRRQAGRTNIQNPLATPPI